MNPLETLLDFINNCLACSALAISIQAIDHRDYQVQSWVCQMQYGPVIISAWRGECDTGHTKYWGRFFYAKADKDRVYYMDRFGNINQGEGAMIHDAYQAPCGS